MASCRYLWFCRPRVSNLPQVVYLRFWSCSVLYNGGRIHVRCSLSSPRPCGPVGTNHFRIGRVCTDLEPSEEGRPCSKRRLIRNLGAVSLTRSEVVAVYSFGPIVPSSWILVLEAPCGKCNFLYRRRCKTRDLGPFGKSGCWYLWVSLLETPNSTFGLVFMHSCRAVRVVHDALGAGAGAVR